MHIPVLKKEVIQYLEPKPNQNFIDCTLGGGGHTISILEETGPDGKVLAIDADTQSLTKAKASLAKYKNRVVLVSDNFENLKEIVKREKFTAVSGILMDLGMSSWQLEESGRGFSFQKAEPLDMRFNPDNLLTAETIVNFWSRADIERILKEFGEEKFSSDIARAIVEARKQRGIKSTSQLVKIIEQAVPRRYLRARLHPATLTFQALRIAVNGELNSLEKALPQASDILKVGGKLVVISFHSLEDRTVKRFFRELGPNFKVLTKKPVAPTREEIIINPRSRSSKLRAVEKHAK